MLDKIPVTQHVVNRLDTDYKAEVVAAALLGRGIPVGQIFIRRRSSNQRSAHKDVAWLRRNIVGFNQPHVVIETNRESIYNYLPEGVFHPPTLGSQYNETADIIEQMRKQKKAEQDARQFFVPFEMEAGYAELAMLDYENQLDDIGNNDELLHILTDLWPMLGELDAASAKVFLHLLPFFSAAKGNRRWFEKCMAAFLGVPVTVEFAANKVEEPDNVAQVQLGHAQLGISTLLCGPHADGNQNWQINIGPVPAQDICRFLPGSHLNHLLQTMYEYCLPATAWCGQQCITVAEEGSFTISAGAHQNYLGYTTFL